jgi:hypothetical protein
MPPLIIMNRNPRINQFETHTYVAFFVTLEQKENLDLL